MAWCNASTYLPVVLALVQHGLVQGLVQRRLLKGLVQLADIIIFWRNQFKKMTAVVVALW